MRLSLRFIVPLALVLGLIAYASIVLVEGFTARWFMRDLEDRSHVLAMGLQDDLIPLLQEGDRTKLNRVIRRVAQDERVYGLGLCDASGRWVTRTNAIFQAMQCPAKGAVAESRILHPASGPVHLSLEPIVEEAKVVGWLALAHDMRFASLRTAATRRYLFLFFAVVAIVVSVTTVLVAHLSWRGWMNSTRALLRGDFGPFSRLKAPRELRPLIKDLRTLVSDLRTKRGVRDASQVSWSPKALKEILQNELRGDEILIVSNREPYIHVRQGDKVEVRMPASGLVTALEPVLRACSGTWIAHGSGNADRETVDAYDRVQVPPEDPSYQIRRIWLTEEEEAGFYFGFANEGLWPLCHIAHNRPTFRHEDWKQYVAVNQKFADAVVQEAKTDNPVVLVQDYHFAVLPAMVKKLLPRATVITFWHIPWPNSESFGICPWREEILAGMLGSDILGFHTPFHCNNFIESVDRFVESKIDRDNSIITHEGKPTAVNNYPISIDFPGRWLSKLPSVAECRKRMHDRLAIAPDVLVGIGVDRFDYTKGILERFRAVERLLELEPAWIGRFSFVQIAAPSRTTISKYQDFGKEVRDLCDSINTRFGKPGYVPINLLVEHHEPWQVYEYFRASETCVVTSLHDGMNLVAKEFVAARDDEQGVLVLSQFTGAARELPEALIVNPYDTDQVAAALHLALSMSPQEQQARIRSMRSLIQEYNIYRWAGRMLIDAARIRRQTKLSRKILSHSGQKAAFLPT
jgi:trehalose-6-phosphate synthase/uncharacterized membrane protein affecting hemolysin expression